MQRKDLETQQAPVICSTAALIAQTCTASRVLPNCLRCVAQVVWQTDTSAEAAKARAEEQLTAAMSSMVTVGNLEAEEAEARKREEKRKAKEEAARLVRPPCHAVPHRVGSLTVCCLVHSCCVDTVVTHVPYTYASYASALCRNMSTKCWTL